LGDEVIIKDKGGAHGWNFSRFSPQMIASFDLISMLIVGSAGISEFTPR